MRPLSGRPWRRGGARQVAPARRRDPAPSRLSYRLQRLWLTPSFRALVVSGLPAFLVAFTLGNWLSDPATVEAMRARLEELRASIAARPEFAVRMMAIDGASDELAQDIREILPIDFPTSSFDLDLKEMRRAVADLDAVAKVDMRIRRGGVLQVNVTERLPAVLWRDEHTLEALDAEGHRVASVASRLDRPDLPLIAGAGADRAVPEALAILAAAEPITGRLRGLVRVGERRWDVVLDRDQRILLPEADPVPALERVIALDEATELLARDVAVVDMRNPSRPTLRLTAAAMEELRRLRAIDSRMVSQ
ncbi:cell division protein FtsQ [Meinhardsimonia xiamenensis]|jgi:cell division protein FtsQ|uniref:Cell division protein FtsQ n=1 Tax=Meinhardsimonia xiamenensis TaxID=990712 RepID=A0A1G9CKJ6_9RHOB|nr:cell division protein FtsQ/DivIB [Meinhardsimonia xiamenensis]PRX38327.1 cell division protein FtsQ [Meinhardsimonia xiamenensis]SDK52210.1 cell division protein FtsQ [Meinhardsimonia xiamenensis]